MFQAVIRVGMTCVLAAGVAVSAYAQQGPGNASAQQRREKRQPDHFPGKKGKG